MSGIGSIGSSPSSSFTSSLNGTSGSSSSLPNGGLSSVGASLQTTGQAPNPTPAASTTSSTGTTLSSYQTEFDNLQSYDDQELLYASFLSPEAGLANFDSVLEQAAQLLGTPENPGPALTQSTTTTPASTSTTSTTTPSTSTSTTSDALSNLPSVASILAASDDEAQQTLTAYANAPVGSSILDYQA
jgi:hypothetical protein